MRLFRRFAALALVLAAVGCGATGGGNSQSSNMAADPSESAVIKVSYIRFNWNERKRRWVGEYRIMLSDSWRRQNGPNPREPFSKLYRNPYKGEAVPDAQMQLLIREMTRCGMAELRSRDVNTINLEALQALEKMPQAAAERVQPWRIINVETETMKKTFVRIDNADSPVLFNKFHAMENEVIKFAVQHTVQITVETDMRVPR